MTIEVVLLLINRIDHSLTLRFNNFSTEATIISLNEQNPVIVSQILIISIIWTHIRGRDSMSVMDHSNAFIFRKITN